MANIGKLTTLLSLLPATMVAQEQPNIILFLVDDMGWQDTSVPFHKDSTIWNRHFQTPSMERLAQKGMKFTNAHAAPVSSPTRVSLITGVNPIRHGVTNWTLSKNQTTDGDNAILGFGQWNVNGFSPTPGLENSFYGTSLAEILKDGGYHNIFVGKAHFGARGTSAEDPLNIGFDRNIGGHAAGGLGSYLGEKAFGNDLPSGNTWGVPDLERYHGKDIFVTEALTLEAKRLMDEALEGDKPFFLYMSHYAVHIPFDRDMRFYPKYIEQGVEEQEARYASIVEGMDKSLGDIMDFLEDREIDDNTIIMFVSDNGGYSVGVRLNTFDGVNKNSPLRGGKGSLYEGGIREPMIVYYPGVTKPSSENSSAVMVEDFYPSILEMANIEEYNTIQELDSRSFIKALSGNKINRGRPLYWHYPNDWGERNNECGAPGSAIAIDGMKLIHHYEDSSNQLYDTNQDIGEQHNLIGTSKRYDKVAKRLAKILSDKLRQDGAPMPYRKSDGSRCPYPDQTL